MLIAWLQIATKPINLKPQLFDEYLQGMESY